MKKILKAKKKINISAVMLTSVVAFFVITFLINITWKIINDNGDLNLYTHQAESFLQGRLDLDANYKDVAVYDGKFYSPFPPYPAVILMPIVAVFGTEATRVIFVALFLTLINAIMLRRILKKLKVENKYIPWLNLAFFLGTGYWYVLQSSSGVWFFAHIVAITCIFFAIDEALGKGRGLLIGLFLGEAFLSRQVMLYAFFFLLAAVWKNSNFKNRKSRILNVLLFVFALSFCIAIYLCMNWVRFDSPFDSGYSYIELTGFLKERVDTYGLFSPMYIPFNFVYMFLQGFHINISPQVIPAEISLDSFGTSITFASPFIFIALLAKRRRLIVKAAWFSVILMILHLLCYYNNGWFQVNTQRFSLDFLPVLICIVALGIKQVPTAVWKALILFSVLLNFLAQIIIPMYNESI
ncbi:MAG: glycosyl transferase family 39 [Patescibacteria group bacterium]|nr:glycosyl transferase family 39 [Patescibacteria group bacterium]